MKMKPNARFPPFLCRSSVDVSPFPLAVAVSVHRCRCSCRCRCVSFCCLNGIFVRNFYRTTEFYNGRTAERRNGNERTATEWWKLGLTLSIISFHHSSDFCYFFLSNPFTWRPTGATSDRVPVPRLHTVPRTHIFTLNSGVHNRDSLPWPLMP